MDPLLWLIHKHAQNSFSDRIYIYLGSFGGISNRNVEYPKKSEDFRFFPGILLLWAASSVGRLFNCLSPSAAFINKPAEISPLAWGAGVERPCFLGMSAILHNWQQNPYLQERHILRPPANNQMLSSAKSGRSRGSLPTKNALHSGNGLKVQIKVEQIDAVINILYIIYT